MHSHTHRSLCLFLSLPDILLEAIEDLRKRTTAGAATFLVKVKTHRGEFANQEADIQADKTVSGFDLICFYYWKQ